jgi:type I restriction enzyme M protein
VDGVDKAKDAVKKDPRLLLDGKVNLPKNDNANYLWIQYFYNYLKPTGRAGFVMASSASDAGHSEKDIREKLVKTGSVDVMMAIGNNFFYTRSLPCTLWFFDRGKESLNYDSSDSMINMIEPGKNQGNHTNQKYHSSDTVLMLDARKIYRKVTSKVNDFSPEQLQNIICIVNLYRGNTKKFESTVKSYLQNATNLAKETAETTTELQLQLQNVLKTVSDFATKYAKENKEAQVFIEALMIEEYQDVLSKQTELIETVKKNQGNHFITEITVQTKALRKPQDKLIKQLLDAINTAAKEYQLSKNKDWKELGLKEQLDQLKALQQQLSGNPNEEEPGLLHETEYFYKQAHWLTSRFPKGVYTDVEGLCKVVTQKEIEAKDWSLSPGRYVGIDTAADDDFDYEERLNEIHIELEGLNEEAVALVNAISENFKTVVI